jgi:hypothetical protein
MDNQEYMNDLAIDPHALEEECLKHSQICMKYTEMAAEFRKVADKAAEKLKVVTSTGKNNVEKIKAKLDLDIRKNPEKYDCPLKKDGTPNLTEGFIANSIVVNDQYSEVVLKADKERSEAYEELVNANFQLDIIKGAADTFSWQRKTSLEIAASLWMSGYWSGPAEARVVPGGKRMIDMATSKIEDKQKEALQRRSRRRS